MCVSHTSCRTSIVIQILQKKHKSNQYFLMQTWIMVWDSCEVLFFPANNIHKIPQGKNIVQTSSTMWKFPEVKPKS